MTVSLGKSSHFLHQLNFDGIFVNFAVLMIILLSALNRWHLIYENGDGFGTKSVHRLRLMG